ATGVVRATGESVQPYSGALEGFVEIHSLLVADGVLTVGGLFQRAFTGDAALIDARNVVQWDGQTWRALGGGVDYLVRALAPDGDGGVLVGGIFGFAGQPDGTRLDTPGLARWTGTQWVAASVPGEPGRVEALGRLGVETLVGGAFQLRTGSGATTVRSTNLAVRSAAGGFRPLSARTGRDGLSAFAAQTVAALGETGCGGVRWAGLPGAAGPLPAGPVRTWDGEAWTDGPPAVRDVVIASPFPNAPPNTYQLSTVEAVPGSCEAFVLGGRFAGVSVGDASVTSQGVVRFDGEAWQPLGRGVEGAVLAVAISANGRVVVGGQFSQVFQADGTPLAAQNVAEWTPGGGWASLGGGVTSSNPSSPGGVQDLLLEADGSIVAVGEFDTVLDSPTSSRPAGSVARWTGTAWETFGGPDVSPSLFYSVTSVERLGGDLVVGGDFYQVVQPGGGALDARGVAAWDGQAWRALAGLNGAVSDLDVEGSTLFAATGDAFEWDGSAWRSLGSESGGIRRLASTDQTLFLGGDFYTAGGIGSPGLAAFDLDGVVAAEPAPAATASDGLRVYPNPARTTATLAFRLDASGPARLALYDVLGRTVAVLAEGERAAGEHAVPVDTSRLPAGVYVARLDTGGSVRSQRFTVVR
ncbi:MAG TPA: T9SS type A sorting domain-containing protein, partial [Rubricoccaceae bacterium]